MARPSKGKPLTFCPLRLDAEVRAECQRLGKLHGTINEGLRVAFGWKSPLANQGLQSVVSVEEVARGPNNREFKTRVFRGPILKPGEKKR